METKKELLEGLSHELRRGTITLGVLSQLKEAQYGYSLVLKLEEKGFAIEPGTLYPLLRRLEKQGLLESSWDTDGTKPRKYYKMSSLGQEVYEELVTYWNDLDGIMQHLVEEE